jgi:hypothetical protein
MHERLAIVSRPVGRLFGDTEREEFLIGGTSSRVRTEGMHPNPSEHRFSTFSWLDGLFGIYPSRVAPALAFGGKTGE